MHTNIAKEKLKAGETIYGVFSNGVSAEMVEIMALAGFDFITIDSEHAPSSDETNRLLIMAAESRNTPIFIRTPNKLDSSILRSLDIGAQGLLLPQVNSVEEAEEIIRAAKYAPQGFRGVGLGRGADYGMGIDLPNYFKQANDNLLIAVQCENIAGVPSLDAIAQVPGVDVIFIGPFDLSQSMGIPGQINAPQVQKIMDTVLEITAKYGKYAGIFTFSVEQAKQFSKLGFRYIIAGSDLRFLSDGCIGAVKELKG
ncbi:2-dehydro-3-deoxyglucarate aldolase [Treponema primitia ZAS-2]|uniref:2-dehydro-3-deoxyglucarate aldolase n=1 Tax=Treponema primitia (strain ATCC BAA-887 / DSM 12427 / ZAS-2) TaxID=545694 RepID=F5YNW3_TREPZ|nr:aldolase/citrate lyase family protein [Treponema primitia]AEF83768.1 2-dehydro-3-deoxyglucarate aldolase [Treponema primitia ZAS-2]